MALSRLPLTLFCFAAFVSMKLSSMTDCRLGATGYNELAVQGFGSNNYGKVTARRRGNIVDCFHAI